MILAVDPLHKITCIAPGGRLFCAIIQAVGQLYQKLRTAEVRVDMKRENIAKVLMAVIGFAVMFAVLPQITAQSYAEDGYIAHDSKENLSDEGQSVRGSGSWEELQKMIDNGGTITLAGDYNADDGDKALVVPEGTKVTLDLNGHTIDRGLAGADDAEDNGNVITVNGDLIIEDSNKSGKGNITGGRNKGDGGGIILNENASLVMNGGTISGNHAEGIGGGVYLGNDDEDKSSTFTMTGGTISNNRSGANGCGVAVREGKFIMSGGTISNNETAEDHGGGVFLIGNTAKFTMEDGASVSQNKAGKSGGGVYVLAGSIDMKGGVISDNTADVDGGGVYIEYGWSGNGIEKQSFHMSGGTITGNTAKKGDGGGVYANVDMTMSGGTISNNDAGKDGGGVFVGGHCDFIMSGESVITGNSVNTFDGDGGGVCVMGSMDMSSGTISNNTAVDGGGVYLYISTFKMTGGAITENKVEQDGGGVDANRDSVFTMSGGSISANTATDGDSGGVLFTGKTFTMSGGEISNNSSDGDGGGVGLYEGTFNLTSGSIVNNKLTDEDADDEHGGGVFVSGGTFNLSGTPVIKDNSGTKGKTENVYLGDDQIITIADALKAGAKAGVSMKKAGTFTTGYKDNMPDADPAEYFTSDNSDYSVLKTQNGEARLGETVDITIAPPVCGDTIEIRDYKYPAGAQPQVTVPENAHYSVALLDDKTPNTYWGTTTSGEFVELEDGYKMKGDQTYTALVFIKAKPGYQIASDVTVRVNGETAYMYNFPGDNQLRIFWDIKATHDWDEWKVTKEATIDEEGIETRSCKGCGREETRAIPKSIQNAKVVLSAPAFAYNGKVLKPAIKTIGGKTLTDGTDYTVAWSDESSRSVGAYTVTITGKGDYTGVTKAAYRIDPKGTNLTKLKKAKKGVTVKWKKQSAKMATSRITGYQILLATNSKFTKGKKTVTVKGYAKVSKKVTKLKGGKKYYVKIRTFKTVGRVKYYSAWSKVKTIKTKR